MDTESQTIDGNQTATEGRFMRAWRGNERLYVVWWIYGMPFKVVSLALGSEWALRSLYGGSIITAGLVALAILAGSAVLSFMAWRCAPNVDEKGLMWLARGLIIFSWLRVVVELATS